MNSYKVIGVMSGTSLDGIDLAYIHFTKSSDWSFVIEEAETVSYTLEMKENLKNAIHLKDDELRKFDEVYTRYLANVIHTFITKKKITEIDAVCSHGHTVLHQPENGITYQIGNLSILSQLIQQQVVCDFRVQDVALGGQGAPLVPIGDELLFSTYDYCLNLGGFANVSFVQNNQRIAYDICPVNIVLNAYAEKLGAAYDKDGNFAKSGTFHQALETELSKLSYYQQAPPKSLGLEWVQQYIFPLLENSTLAPKDILATFTIHIAKQLAQNFHENATILCTGGGTYNTFLLETLQHQKKLHIQKSSTLLIEYKEALIFGFLGVLRMRNEINCLKSVTGATKDHSSGKIYRYQ